MGSSIAWFSTQVRRKVSSARVSRLSVLMIMLEVKRKKLRCSESLMFGVELLANSAVVCIVTLCIQKQQPEVFYKKVFLELLQNSQGNISARVSFLIKLQVGGLELY